MSHFDKDFEKIFKRFNKKGKEIYEVTKNDISDGKIKTNTSDGSIDVIFDFAIGCRTARIEPALDEYYRILKKKGTLVIVFWAKNFRDYNKKGLYFWTDKVTMQSLVEKFKLGRTWLIYDDGIQKLRVWHGKKI